MLGEKWEVQWLYMEPEGIGPTLSITDEENEAHNETGRTQCHTACSWHNKGKHQTPGWAVTFTPPPYSSPRMEEELQYKVRK